MLGQNIDSVIYLELIQDLAKQTDRDVKKDIIWRPTTLTRCVQSKHPHPRPLRHSVPIHCLCLCFVYYLLHLTHFSPSFPSSFAFLRIPFYTILQILPYLPLISIRFDLIVGKNYTKKRKKCKLVKVCVMQHSQTLAQTKVLPFTNKIKKFWGMKNFWILLRGKKKLLMLAFRVGSAVES